MRDINRELTPFSRPHHAHTQATHRQPARLRVRDPKYRRKTGDQLLAARLDYS